MSMQHVLSPMKIGNVLLKNRFVMPAMDSSTTTPDHKFSQQSIDYLSARAKGGFALVIAEFLCVDPSGFATPNQVGIYDDSFIDHLKQLTTAIHEKNGTCAAQIHHAGIQTSSATTNAIPFAVSSIPSTKYKEPVKEMTTEEVYRMIEKFIDAGERAKKAGFDFVEVHGAHGYLIAQFMSKATNKRCDEFGGSYENRARFASEIIKGIKIRCGSDYPIIFRLSANEFMDGGNDIQDAIIYAKLAEAAGADAIHVSTGSAAGGNIVTTYHTAPGFNVGHATQIKNSVSIPVICVGRINDPVLAEDIIASGKADFISLGRQSICDSEFPNKIMEGRLDEIFHCTGCMQRCYYSKGCDQEDKGISCMINPFSGKEGRWKITEAMEKKSIGIIGGGVAGLEAAWILAKRGHEVHVYEKKDKLGGQYCLAAVPKKKQDLGQTIFTFHALGKRYGVHYHMKTEMNEDRLRECHHDIIILSTGAKPLLPNIEGIHEAHVIQANDILSGKYAICDKKVLVIGGGLVGCETAEFLLQYHNHVDIVEKFSEFAQGMNKYPRMILMKELDDQGCIFYPGTEVMQITKDGIIGKQREKDIVLNGYDTVVIALGSKPDVTLQEFVQANYETYVLGDAFEVRDAKYAIFDAAKLAITL